MIQPVRRALSEGRHCHPVEISGSTPDAAIFDMLPFVNVSFFSLQ